MGPEAIDTSHDDSLMSQRNPNDETMYGSKTIFESYRIEPEMTMRPLARIGQGRCKVGGEEKSKGDRDVNTALILFSDSINLFHYP